MLRWAKCGSLKNRILRPCWREFLLCFVAQMVLATCAMGAWGEREKWSYYHTEHFGYINKQGMLVISPDFEGGSAFAEGVAWVLKGGKFGLINRRGEMLISPRFDDVKSFSEGLAAVCEDEKWGFVDHEGRWVIEKTYTEAQSFSCGYARVSLGEKRPRSVEWPLGIEYFHIDRQGNRADEVVVRQSDPCNLWITENDGKWGYEDDFGRVVIAFQFDGAEAFSEGLASVTLNGKCGYIDRKGEFVITPRYDWGDEFSEGLAVVKVDGKKGVIDRGGNYLVDPMFETIWPFGNGVAIFAHRRLYGLLSMSGEVILPPRFNDIDTFADGLACVQISENIRFIEGRGGAMGVFR